jgi:23S rRNA (adenine2030-N6)-methyltransferase
MNYRHAFHAGNFADVMKHALMARILLHLKAKETAFRYHDTHAGIGYYDLAGSEAQRTGEADFGVRRFLAAPQTPGIELLFRPYVDVLRAVGAHVHPVYPGSPMIAAQMLRPQDRLMLAELHEEDHAQLQSRFRRDDRVKVVPMDGWQAVRAWSPPLERRGVMLIDPPFEQKDEFQRMTKALVEAHRRWATGIFALWYPVKTRREVEDFMLGLQETGIPKILRLELRIGPFGQGLAGSGLIVVNPPWKLADEARGMLKHLAKIFVDGRPGHALVEWVSGEE